MHPYLLGVCNVAGKYADINNTKQNAICRVMNKVPWKQ